MVSEAISVTEVRLPSFSPSRSNCASRSVHWHEVLRPTLPKQEAWTPAAQPELVSRYSHCAELEGPMQWVSWSGCQNLDRQQTGRPRDPGWPSNVLSLNSTGISKSTPGFHHWLLVAPCRERVMRTNRAALLGLDTKSRLSRSRSPLDQAWHGRGGELSTTVPRHCLKAATVTSEENGQGVQ